MSSTRGRCFLILGLMIAAAASVAGCSKSTSRVPTSGSTTLTSVEVVASPMAKPPVTEVTNVGAQLPQRHGGVAILIAAALEAMEVSAPQRAEVDRIAAELRTSPAPAHEAWRRFDYVIADGVAVGHVDRAKADDAEANLLTAMSSLHESTAGALDQLHEILTPKQRITLVDKLNARWDGWKKLQGETPPARRRDIAVLQRDLGLTPEQASLVFGQLQTDLPAAAYEARIEKHLHAFGRAFASATFDAKMLATERAANRDMASWRAERITQIYTAAAPVLTPEQRTKLAFDLRRHADTSD